VRNQLKDETDQSLRTEAIRQLLGLSVVAVGLITFTAWIALLVLGFRWFLKFT
jgi:hypothetical protein